MQYLSLPIPGDFSEFHVPGCMQSDKDFLVISIVGYFRESTFLSRNFLIRFQTCISNYPKHLKFIIQYFFYFTICDFT